VTGSFPLFNIIFSRDHKGRVHIEKFEPTEEFKKVPIPEQIKLIDYVILETEGARNSERVDKSCTH